VSRADLVIRNGWVVNAGGRFHGGVAVADGRIVHAGPDTGLPQAARVIDADEQLVIPGLIDPHVHLSSEEDESLEEGLTANVPTETRGMAHGGVTTFGHFVGHHAESLADQVRTTIRAFDHGSYVDSFLHAYVMGEESLAEQEQAWSLGVTSFKHFYTAYGRRAREHSGLGQILRPVGNDILLRSMQWIAARGAPCLAMVHAEDGDIIEALSGSVADGRSDLAAWTDSRPAVAEWTKVQQAIALSDFTHAPLYIAHMTTKESCHAVARARAAGSQVHAEAGPQWLTHDASMEAEIGCWGKVNPPLRWPADVEALWRGFRTGGVTCLGTDHGTGGRTRATKENGGGKHGNIWSARPGVRGGSEHLLPVMMTHGVHTGRLTVEDLVRFGSYNTARAFGLWPRKGNLEPGADADLVIVDPDRGAVVDDNFYHSVNEVSIYNGQRLRGMARIVAVRGTVTVEDYETAAAPGHGRYQPRGPAPAVPVI
jgi:dihydropyrimidinase